MDSKDAMNQKNSSGSRRWNSSTSTAQQSRSNKNNSRKIGVNKDALKMLSDNSKGGGNDQREQSLVKLEQLVGRHSWRWKRLAFDRWKGIFSSSIGTIAFLDDEYHVNNNIGFRDSSMYQRDTELSGKWTQILYSHLIIPNHQQETDQNHRFQNHYSDTDDDNYFDYRKFKDEYGDDSEDHPTDETQSERSKSPELFNATSGEPLDMDEVSDFYKPNIVSEYPMHSDQITSNFERIDNVPLRKRHDLEFTDDWKKTPKISTSPATARLQRRVTFEDTQSELDDSFLKKLEAEMIPFYERSQQLNDIDRKWKTNKQQNPISAFELPATTTTTHHQFSTLNLQLPMAGEAQNISRIQPNSLEKTYLFTHQEQPSVSHHSNYFEMDSSSFGNETWSEGFELSP
jgi:hypothetical protein